MRLKIYTAATMNEAMELVRSDLGEDAVIVATESLRGGDGVKITAALETDEGDSRHLDVSPEVPARRDPIGRQGVRGTIRHALAFHGVPPALADLLAESAAAFDAEAPLVALAGALHATFEFASIAPSGGRQAIMLVGQPGAGKTLGIAKLAMRLKRAEKRATVISLDTRRAGGVEQLAAYTRILGFELVTAESSEDVARAVSNAMHPVLIDTAGTDPFFPSDRRLLTEWAEAAGAAPVLVMAGGGDPMESMDVAAAFADLGTDRVFATKLDLARRMGGLLAACDTAGAAFCEASTHYQVAEGLVSLNSVALARLMLPPAPETSAISALEEAVP